MRSSRIVFVVLAVLAATLISVVAGAIPAEPANDDAVNATAITSTPFTGMQTTVGATQEDGEYSQCNTPSEETVWFSYTATSEQGLFFSVSADDWQPVVWVFKGNPGSTAGDLTSVGGCGSSYGVIETVPGTTYYFRVAGYSWDTPNSGDFTFLFDDLDHQDFANADLYTDLPVHARSANYDDFFRRGILDERAAVLPATIDGLEEGEPQPCGAIGFTMWYQLDLGVDAAMTANTFDVSGDLTEGAGPADAAPRTTFDTVLAVYSGPPDATFDDLVLLGCNDDTGQGVSRVDFDGIAGTTYYFQVGGFDAEFVYLLNDAPATGPFGIFDLTISALCADQPATIVGTNGHDEILGTNGPDIIAGLTGNDLIDGLRGSDIICGDEGFDTLFGGQGRDHLYGGDHGDDLFGGTGADRLYGGRGFDLGNGGKHVDRCGTEVTVACENPA